jgi:curved DNA-binding protein
MIFKDYYKILGLTKTASQDDIKKAYRKLAMVYHPDKNDGDKESEEKFKEIVEAYEVLSNPEKRAEFDGFLGKKTQTQNYTYSYKSKQSTQDDLFWDDLLLKYKKGPFSEFFRKFFDKKASSGIFKGDDIKGKVTIDLEEAYLGSTRILNVQNEKLRLQIKPGTRSEQILKVTGKGKKSPVASGTHGDLYVRISVKEHDVFKQIDNDLFTNLEVDIYTILLGGKVQIKTLKGDIYIEIPQGTSYGKQLRIKGLGMPDYDKPETFGDLYVKVLYSVPKNLTQKEKDLLNELYQINKQR